MLLIRSLVFTVFLFITALLGGLAVLVTFWAPDRWHWWLTVSWCRLSVWAGEFFCNMHVVVEGAENIPDEPSVIMIKHTTALETYWQVTAFPRATWVIKREILWIPLFGWAVALLLDPIAINRSSGRRAVKQVIEKGTQKLAGGIWVTVFPEGTRMPPGATRKYGVSGAALAQSAGVRIVPVAHNAGDLWQRRSFLKRPGTVRFVIGPPIDASAQAPKETNAIVQAWIEDKMREISVHYR
ncbi:MAG: lysophospholipid acyltransferase family protein [Woeseiaceae bacterium]|nr:lysophospholipid acyltransferase family protein [Woeseiaceae bacterium]